MVQGAQRHMITKEDIIKYNELDTKMRQVADWLLPNEFVHSIETNSSETDLLLNFRDRDGDHDSLKVSIEEFLQCTSKEKGREILKAVQAKAMKAYEEKRQLEKIEEQKRIEASEKAMLKSLKAKYEN